MVTAAAIVSWPYVQRQIFIFSPAMNSLTRTRTLESLNMNTNPSNAFPDFDLIDLRSRAVSAASKRGEVTSLSSIALTPPASTQPDSPRSLGNATETSDLQPIAVFSKVRSSPQLDKFIFLGWFETEETELFALGSSDLVKMLEQRSGRASKEDLENEWAKIKLVRQYQSDNVRLDEL